MKRVETMADFQVEFYTKKNGESPVFEFIGSLDVQMKARLFRTIQLLQLHGNTIQGCCSKPLGDGIFEIRARAGSSISRVLYFFFIGRKIILTNGFIKKTQKTPAKEIETAKKYRAEYIDRENGK